MITCPHCGAEFDSEHPGKPRSLPDHQRLFVLIQRAFDIWPEAHEFQPLDAQHLRYWLTCKAGPQWRTGSVIQWPGLDSKVEKAMFVAALEAAIRAGRDIADKSADQDMRRAFVFPHGKAFAVVRAKSIAFEKMPQSEFSRLRDDISDVIEAETNTSIEAIMSNQPA